MSIRFLSILLFIVFSFTCKASSHYTSINFSNLIEESINKNGAPGEGLSLIVEQNSCSRQPENEIEMNLCMGEGIWNPDRSGFSDDATTLTTSTNPFGLENNVTMRYSGFFYVSEPNTWSFYIKSQGATDLFIDGRNIVNWYSQHSTNDATRKGSIYLEIGWHQIQYRYINLLDDISLKLSYSKGGNWYDFSTGTLQLKNYGFTSGLSFVTAKERLAYSPVDHETLDALVNLEYDNNVSYSGVSSVTEVSTDKPYGIDNNYTSAYEGWFYVRDGRSGSWNFRLDSADVADVSIDGEVLVYDYDGDSNLQDSVSLDVGWHKIKILALNGVVSPNLSLHVTPPSESEQLFSNTNVPMMSNAGDMDFDGLHQDIEMIMGTDPLNRDSDADMLRDYAELQLGINPHDSDTNHDGRSDYMELIGAKYNTMTKTYDNLWSRDNDRDGVPDGLDISPSTKTDLRDSFHFEIDTQGKATYLDFQIRPENTKSLKWLGKTFNWPNGDTTGQMQDRDNTKKDVRLIPMLELTSDILPTQASVQDAGIMITDDTKLPSYDADYTHNDGFGAGNLLGDAKAETVVAGDKGHEIVIRDGKGKRLKSFNSVFSKGDILTVGDVLGDSYDEIIILHGEYIYIYSAYGGLYLKADANTGRYNNQIATGHYIPTYTKKDIVVATGSKLLLFDVTKSDGKYILRQDASKTINTEDDGFTLGDIDGDGIDEIWLARNISDSLEIFRYQSSDSFDLMKTVSVDFDLSDGLLAYDILPSDDVSNAEYGEEIIVLKKDGGIKVYTELSHESSADNETYEYSTFDGFGASDFTGDGVDEIIISADTSGAVSMYAPQKRKAYIPLMPVQEYGETVAFQGRMLYSTSDKSSIKLISDVRLVWMVVGQTDTEDDSNANETTVLAHYTERFSMTGFSAEEELENRAALLYNEGDSTSVTNSYTALLEEFVHSNRTLRESFDYLSSNGISFSEKFSDALDGSRDVVKYLEDEIEKLVTGVNKLADGQHPIILATQNRSASIGLNEIAKEGGSAYTGDFMLNLVNTEALTVNTLKQNWYDTSQVPLATPMNLDEISTFIDSGSGSEIEKENKKIFAFIASLGTFSAVQSSGLDFASKSSAISWIDKGFNLSYSVLWAGYDGVTTYLKVSKQFNNFWTHYEGAKSMKQLKQANSEAGFASKMIQKLSFGKIKPATAVKIIKWGGAALSVATSIYVFYAIASASGWSASGIALGIVAGTAYLVHGLALTFIASFVPVGTVIAALIVFSDIIAWLITGEAWSDKAVKWLMNAVSKTTMPKPGFDITAMKVSIADYDDNGLTTGDRIDIRFRATQTMKRGKKVTGYSYDKLKSDLRDSYYKPESYFPTYIQSYGHCINIETKETTGDGLYSCLVNREKDWILDPLNLNIYAGSQRYIVDTEYEYDSEGLKKIRNIWDYGAWVEPKNADNKFKITLFTTLSLKLKYGKCTAGVCSRETEKDSQTLDKDLEFDVLPSTLDDFVNWSILRPLDSDNDGLIDEYEDQSNSWFTFYGEKEGTEQGYLYITTDSEYHVIPREQDYYPYWHDIVRFVPSSEDGYVNIMNKYGSLMRRYSSDDASTPGGQWKLERSINGKILVINHNNGDVEGIRVPTHAVGSTASVDFARKASYADEMLWRIEPAGGATSSSRYDSDGDGLSDYYELSLHVDGIFLDPLSDDSDGDGLKDREELIFGSDPTKSDTDGDGLSDKLEYDGFRGKIAYNGRYFTTRYYANPREVDSDFDSVSDKDEYTREYAHNPFSIDTDGDGSKDSSDADPLNVPSGSDSDNDDLNDSVEQDGFTLSITTSSSTADVHVDSDSIIVDTDGDGLNDYQEYQLTNPRSDDTDSDGLKDINETQYNTDPLNFDSDGDGISDGDEVLVYHSDPLNIDSDSDDLNDSEEIRLGTNIIVMDSDSDGIIDGDEIGFGTNPLSADSDSDDLNDTLEIHIYFTDPLVVDSDGDGLNDGEEVYIYITNPARSDSDGDTLSDYYEVHYGDDPNKGDINASMMDSDGDGLNDDYEINISGSKPYDPDSDRDSLNDSGEVFYDTGINDPDTDDDSLTDGEEVHIYHTNPLVADSDGDGLTDWEEVQLYHTNPNNPDTDNDGIIDAWDRDIIYNAGYGQGEVLLVLDDNLSEQDSFVEKLDSIVTEMGKTLVTAYRDDVNISQYHWVVMLGIPDVSEANTTVNYMMSQFIPQDIIDKMRAEIDIPVDANASVIEDANISSMYNRRTYISDTLFNGLERADYNATYLQDEIENNEGNWTELTRPATPLREFKLQDSIVIMLTRLIVDDVYWVMQEFNQLERDYFANSVQVRYPLVPTTAAGEDDEKEFIALDGVLHADTNLTLAHLSSYEVPNLSGGTDTHYPVYIAAAISRYNEENTPVDINVSSDVEALDIPLAKFIEIDIVTAKIENEDGVATYPIMDSPIVDANIRFYYTKTDLDRNSNRVIGDIEDINESTLVLYHWDGNVSNIDDNDSSWSKVTANVTRYTDDITVEGNEYAGYLEANVSRLGFFALAGEMFIDDTLAGLPYMLSSSPDYNTTDVSVDTNITVQWSEPVKVLDGYDIELYGADIIKVLMDDDNVTMYIVHDTLTEGIEYILTINPASVADFNGNENNLTFGTIFTTQVTNNIPFAINDSANTNALTPISFNVLSDNGSGVDYDSDGDSISIVSFEGNSSYLDTNQTGSEGGIFHLNSSGVIDFYPNGDFENVHEGDTLTTTVIYSISDGTSQSSAVVSVNVSGMNHAPVMSSDTRYLSSIVQNCGDDDGFDSDGDDDAFDNHNNSGTLVSDILLSTGSISDSDGDSIGISVDTVNNTNGIWQYSTDKAQTWSDITSSLPIFLHEEDRVRFVPNLNHYGISNGGLHVRAWDGALNNSLSQNSADVLIVVNQQNQSVDTDGDGLSDGDEITLYNTSPYLVDSDGDWLSDWDEVMTYHTNPNLTDSDGDTLSDYDEVINYHTNPNLSDSDGDGYSDSEEIAEGSNPNDSSDTPNKNSFLPAIYYQLLLSNNTEYKTLISA